MVGAVEPAVHDRAMSRKAEIRAAPSPKATAAVPKPKAKAARKSAATSLEQTIGYRFSDSALLEHALTHISALKGAQGRTGSYQRLEFLGDHVLGLAISEMLFAAFPKASHSLDLF